MLSARAKLARRVLRMLKEGQSVPAQDGVQLRNWAVHPDDAVLPLEEIARRILNVGRKLEREKWDRADKSLASSPVVSRLLPKHSRTSSYVRRSFHLNPCELKPLLAKHTKRKA
jgi:hypothetical protein